MVVISSHEIHPDALLDSLSYDECVQVKAAQKAEHL